MWIVTVKQNDNVVGFGFNNMSDALEFSETCLECGDEGTEIIIREENK